MNLQELVLRLRARDPEWPRYREGAQKDEKLWIESLDDRELAQLAAELHTVERTVKAYRKRLVEDVVEDEDAA